MRPLFQLFSRHIAGHSRKAHLQASAATASTALLSMAAYSASVAKHPGVSPNDAAAKPHHVKDRRGRTTGFRNPHPSFTKSKTLDIFMLFFKWHIGLIKFPEPTGKEVSVVPAQFLQSRIASPNLRATWLGHACYYLEYPSGLRVLFDPVMENHCTPVSFVGFKRYTQPPCDLSALPYVDVVVISHNHYDHLSYPSVCEIQKNHPNTHFFVPLGLESWFKKAGIANVTEMDWWDDAEITLSPEAQKSDAGRAKSTASSNAPHEPIKARISCLPSQHTSSRKGFDENKTLWSSWGIASGGKSVWFGGDTGYRSVPQIPKDIDDYGSEYSHLPVCPQFRQIGELCGPFDLGLIPIGAYEPRHIFLGEHANPVDAVNIFQDIKCRRAMAIHWGTWVLTPEEVLEPPRRLKETLRLKGLPETGVFDVCAIGESREF
ncbi:putative Zn-dependent hydrolase/oxidoreductase family protein [Pseudomassariella vexata]|uniref:Putative Zn-dependent hydrolase/oxidoreductase family protein n=1 Tax=Pseudomassariella vexata TaxID=1141098 RepID=A0A1Y2DRB6_9PEZI|nr:putative Zn-dependent hydrolase/oxidoreductase family protein [Pseudomassariella vexata]ORY61215.1 putative Zn-dependent hydrolase/oxidoreductase family protein [Pseudomassariella vexata]